MTKIQRTKITNSQKKHKKGEKGGIVFELIMAYLEFDIEKLKINYNFLNDIFSENNIQWAIVTKVLCGNKQYLVELAKLGVKQICDSRLTNLKIIKQLDESIETIYIKPPSRRSAATVIKYVDISINTELSTIKTLSREAVKQNINHKIIIMIEMGELREGVMRSEFINFYEKVFKLPNIEVVGIGANFSCLYGVLPNQDKLIQLSLYEQLIEAIFNKEIPYISGGSSVVIPLLLKGILPSRINHFRVGETFEFKDSDIGKNTCRAILGLGLLDVDEKHIWATDKNIEFIGASSDMIVIDIKDNPKNCKVGDILEFTMDYMGLLRLMNSKYIDKRIKQKFKR